MKCAQIDEGIDQGILISDGLVVAEFRAFDAQGLGLRIDAFSSGSLFENLLVLVRLTVKLVAQASANGGRQGRNTTTLVPILVVNRATLTGWLREKQGASIATFLMFDEAGFRLKG